MRAVADVDEDLPLILSCSLDDVPAPHRYNYAIMEVSYGAGSVFSWYMQPRQRWGRQLGILLRRRIYTHPGCGETSCVACCCAAACWPLALFTLDTSSCMCVHRREEPEGSLGASCSRHSSSNSSKPASRLAKVRMADSCPRIVPATVEAAHTPAPRHRGLP
jgi:hypothetical protein